MEEVIKAILNYGGMGIALLLSLYANHLLLKANKALHAKKEAIHERYSAKAETWINQFHEKDKTAMELMDRMERRWGQG